MILQPISNSIINSGSCIQSDLFITISTLGRSVSISNVTYIGLVKKVPKRDVPYLASVLGINSANPDIRRVIFSPDSIPSGYFVEGTTLSLVEGGETLGFTLVSRDVCVVSGIDTEVRYIAYRIPQPSSASAAPPGETSPGNRKLYPPPNTTW